MPPVMAKVSECAKIASGLVRDAAWQPQGRPQDPERRDRLEVGEELLVPMALDLRNVGLPQEGAYSVEIGVDGTHHKTLQFWSQPPQLAPGS